MYRFKTEKEFIEEFGENWKEKVKRTWNYGGKMDYLLGKEITEEEYKKALEDNLYIGRWTISKDMVKEDSFKKRCHNCIRYGSSPCGVDCTNYSKWVYKEETKDVKDVKKVNIRNCDSCFNPLHERKKDFSGCFDFKCKGYSNWVAEKDVNPSLTKEEKLDFDKLGLGSIIEYDGERTFIIGINKEEEKFLVHRDSGHSASSYPLKEKYNLIYNIGLYMEQSHCWCIGKSNIQKVIEYKNEKSNKDIKEIEKESNKSSNLDFKVGDFVKVIKKSKFSSELEVGKIFEIKRIDKSDYTLMLIGSQWIDMNCVEKVEKVDKDSELVFHIDMSFNGDYNTFKHLEEWADLVTNDKSIEIKLKKKIVNLDYSK